MHLQITILHLFFWKLWNFIWFLFELVQLKKLAGKQLKVNRKTYGDKEATSPICSKVLGQPSVL